MPPIASALGDIAASLAAVATVGLFFAALWAAKVARDQLGGLRTQLQHERHAEARRRVYDHLARMFDPGFVAMEAEALRFFSEVPEPQTDDRWQAAWDRITQFQRLRILAAVNFYEVVAGEYNDIEQELLHKETADKALSEIVSQMWVEAEPFLGWRRRKFKEDRIFQEWERLYRAFTGKDTSAGEKQTSPLAQRQARTGALTSPQAQPGDGGGQPRDGGKDGGSDTPSKLDEGCPPNPCVAMPKRVLVVAGIWAVLLLAGFAVYIEISAVATFFPKKLGPLPFPVIWFGAVGGLLISLEGIFKHNREWLRSYDYWHYLRPGLGALMGSLGCLVFAVLAAAASPKAQAADAAFYDVVALVLGYREASFRALLTKLLDTVLVPGETKSDGRAPTRQAGS